MSSANSVDSARENFAVIAKATLDEVPKWIIIIATWSSYNANSRMRYALQNFRWTDLSARHTRAVKVDQPPRKTHFYDAPMKSDYVRLVHGPRFSLRNALQGLRKPP